jgi:hypothetical protein
MEDPMEQVRAAEIVLERGPAGTPVAAWAALVAGVLILLGVACLVWRSRRGVMQGAFAKMARAAGLGREDRRTVRALAAGVGLDPAVMLATRSALERAVAEAGAGARVLAKVHAAGAARGAEIG